MKLWHRSSRIVSINAIFQRSAKYGDCWWSAKTGSVTLIQRFGSALNLNLHFHILFIDGVYPQKKNDRLVFHRVKAPSASELNSLVEKISQRTARHLEKQGLLTRDEENSYLTMEGLDDNVMNELHGHSITYRIAVGPQQGHKVFRVCS